MLFVPRRLRIPLIALSAASVCLWGVAIAGAASDLDDRVTAVLSAAAATVTVFSGSAWLMLGIAFMMRDRDKEVIIGGIVDEVRKRVADDQPGRLRLLP